MIVVIEGLTILQYWKLERAVRKAEMCEHARRTMLMTVMSTNHHGREGEAWQGCRELCAQWYREFFPTEAQA